MIKISDDWPTKAEVKKIVVWLQDKALMKYSEQRHDKHSIQSQYCYIEDMRSYPNIYCKILNDSTIIGTVSATIDVENQVADVGILIGSGYIGKGYGRTAWAAFCGKLDKLGVRKIEAGCMAKNKAMIRIFEKTGMRLEGTRRYHFQTKKDQYDHMVLYGMLT